MSPKLYDLLMREKLAELRRRASDRRLRSRATSVRRGTTWDATP
jgi:hypothetical protein